MRALVLAVLVLAAAASPAQALTLRDVIELTRAGLADEVLLALIEVDGGVYATDPATLKGLKEAGVSDKVMIALIRSGRERRAEEVPPPVAVDEATGATTAPPVVVIEHHDVIEHREPQVQQIAVPVPVYVPVYTSRQRGYRDQDGNGTIDRTYVPFQSGLPAVRPRQEPAAPVYWGFGGKLRPDAWGQPAAADRDKDKDKDKDKPDEGDRKRAAKK